MKASPVVPLLLIGVGAAALLLLSTSAQAAPLETHGEEPEEDLPMPHFLSPTNPADFDAPLAAHFDWEEATASETAKRYKLSNLPSAEHKANMRRLGVDLDRLRKAIKRALDVESWFRSAEVNARISGSSKSSRHLTGEAADVKANGLADEDLASIVLALNAIEKAAGHPPIFDQLIAYSYTSHLHYGIRAEGNREELLFYQKGEKSSRPWSVTPATILPDGRFRLPSGKVV